MVPAIRFPDSPARILHQTACCIAECCLFVPSLPNCPELLRVQTAPAVVTPAPARLPNRKPARRWASASEPAIRTLREILRAHPNEANSSQRVRDFGKAGLSMKGVSRQTTRHERRATRLPPRRLPPLCTGGSARLVDHMAVGSYGVGVKCPSKSERHGLHTMPALLTCRSRWSQSLLNVPAKVRTDNRSARCNGRILSSASGVDAYFC